MPQFGKSSASFSGDCTRTKLFANDFSWSHLSLIILVLCWRDLHILVYLGILFQMPFSGLGVQTSQSRPTMKTQINYLPQKYFWRFEISETFEFSFTFFFNGKFNSVLKKSNKNFVVKHYFLSSDYTERVAIPYEISIPSIYGKKLLLNSI